MSAAEDNRSSSRCLCTKEGWGVFCQWGGALACIFFVVANIAVIAEWASKMDKITLLLRLFSMIFALAIFFMSISKLRLWCKGYLAFAWFLGNWAIRGFFLVYLAIIAASSYSIVEKTITMETEQGKRYCHDEAKTDDWVEVSRYLCGGLLLFFGILYSLLACMGLGKEDNMEQPAWSMGGKGGPPPSTTYGEGGQTV